MVNGRGSDGTRADPSREPSSLRSVLGIFLASRILVLATSSFAIVALTPVALVPGIFEVKEPGVGPYHPFSAWPLGGLFDVLATPLSRWDAGHYLTIARDGYDVNGEPGAHVAFFPFYPVVVRLVAGGPFANDATLMLGAEAVSLVAFFAALAFLFKLVRIDYGPRVASATVTLVAFFPASFYYSAPYSEGVFLATTVGAVLAARQGRWALAGAAAACASGTRLIGLVVLVPLVILYLYGPRADRAPDEGQPRGVPKHPITGSAAWLLLAPAGIVAYCVYLQVAFGEALAFLRIQREAFSRLTTSPPDTIRDAFVSAWEALNVLGRNIAGSQPVGHGWSWENAQAAIALLQFTLMCLALIALVGAVRRLLPAYSAYAFASMVVILSSGIRTYYPPDEIDRPLQSLHRFVAVIFPLFMWLALLCEKHRATPYVAGAFGVGLGLFTTMFATRHWLV